MAIIVLENIRSVFNVGAFFRLGDAAAIERMLLIGYTAQPTDRMGRTNLRIAKTALGAERHVQWESHETTMLALEKYSTYTPIAVEQTEHSRAYHERRFTNPMFIFGNEVDGVSEETLEHVKYHVHIPMYGKKESLNVAVAAGIVLYHHICPRE